jgi:hypothetical protein
MASIRLMGLVSLTLTDERCNVGPCLLKSQMISGIAFESEQQVIAFLINSGLLRLYCCSRRETSSSQ